MGKLIGDNERHAWMDNMLGGDGSDSLKAYNMDLGYRYLKDEPLTIQSMMMGNRNFARGSNTAPSVGYGMMGGSWGGNYLLIVGLIVFLIIVVIIFLVFRKKTRTNAAATGNSALDILNQRFEKGEIPFDEFLKMKKNLLK